MRLSDVLKSIKNTTLVLPSYPSGSEYSVRNGVQLCRVTTPVFIEVTDRVSLKKVFPFLTSDSPGESPSTYCSSDPLRSTSLVRGTVSGVVLLLLWVESRVSGPPRVTSVRVWVEVNLYGPTKGLPVRSLVLGVGTVVNRNRWKDQKL